tara:strand:- start:521 stop:1189 length:669 start_codon:yes stop_codon:yes gene_type:complete
MILMSDEYRIINVLIVGLGGIGSQLTDLIAPVLRSTLLLPEIRLHLMDGDIVEEGNLGHQRFTEDDIGKSKAEVLSKRHHVGWKLPVIIHNKNLASASQLEGYDIIVVAVDRQEPRQLVHNSGAHWVDLRCRGDGWLLIDSDTNRNILAKIPQNEKPVGCQLPGAVADDNIEFGFAAVAALGAQWLMQKIRMLDGRPESKTPKFSMGYLTHGQMKTSVLEEI